MTDELLSLVSDRDKYIKGTSSFVDDCNAPEKLFISDRIKGFGDGGQFFCPVLRKEITVYNGKCKQPCTHNPVMSYI